MQEWRRGLSLAKSLSPGRGPLNGALSAPQLPLSKLHLWALAPMSPGRADWTPLCSCGDVRVCVQLRERLGDQSFISQGHKYAASGTVLSFSGDAMMEESIPFHMFSPNLPIPV